MSGHRVHSKNDDHTNSDYDCRISNPLKQRGGYQGDQREERLSKKDLDERAKELGIEPTEGLVSIEILEHDKGKLTIYETDSSPEA